MISQKNLIADFYMYEYLVNSNPTIDDDLEAEIESQAMQFLEELKEYLITALEYSIIREISHVWWESVNPNTMNPPTPKYMSSIISEEIYYILVDMSPDWIDTLSVDLYSDEQLEGSLRLRQYMFIKNHKEIDTAVFIGRFKKYFTKLAWRNNFGGEKWVSIVNSYLNLKKTSGKDLFLVCDTIFWLQHNTNTVFNKIKSWEENGSYDWINEFLDFRKECDLWELWEYCGKSKKVAGKKLKHTLNKTKEDSMSNMKLTVGELGKTVKEIIVKDDEGSIEYNEGITLIDMEGSFKTLEQNLISQVKFINDSSRTHMEKFIYDGFETKINETKEHFTSSINDVEDMIKEFPDDLDLLKNDLMDRLERMQKDSNAYMSNIDNTITMFKAYMSETKEDIVEDVTNTVIDNMSEVEDRLSTNISSTKKEITSLVDEKVNTILEKLEQRWYKSMWKAIKSMFTK